jgi:uncharacterized membrane protein
MAGSRSKEIDGAKSEADAGDYAREAASQWATAARLGVAAVAPRLKNVGRVAKGGAVGNLADKALAKMGRPGQLASGFALGSRLTQRLRGDDEDLEETDAEGSEEGITVPIQESMEVAVPVSVAFRLCTRFEEYPGYLERVEHVERKGDDQVEFVARIRGQRRRLPIEVFDARPNERIDWRSTNGIEHSGAITFHALAPRLTHIELSLDFAPRGLVRRIARRAHLPDRVVRAEMHRFKAYAELYEDEEPGDQKESGGEEPSEGDEAQVEQEEVPAAAS